MSFDPEVPDPPRLDAAEDPGDYDAVEEPETRTGEEGRREALAEFLAEGAWEDGFAEWADNSYLDDEQFEAARELGLVGALDFYWNETAGDVGYRAPELATDLPQPWDDRLDRNDRADIEEALDELGRTVSEVLENRYVDRSSEAFGYTWD
ncbi:hypothetical protein [Halosimplex carlsbadense]|uniref:hypothetical protein n=1 Tax=Halosimplex carlsbadense TaxID=171164 RepID=UPI000677EFB5|nr:hypothetical protein [Halosimplex carlsbadense]